MVVAILGSNDLFLLSAVLVFFQEFRLCTPGRNFIILESFNIL